MFLFFSFLSSRFFPSLFLFSFTLIPRGTDWTAAKSEFGFRHGPEIPPFSTASRDSLETTRPREMDISGDNTRIRAAGA